MLDAGALGGETDSKASFLCCSKGRALAEPSKEVGPQASSRRKEVDLTRGFEDPAL